MSNAIEARKMLRAHRYGVLSTISKKFAGYPFGSITPYLVDHDGRVLVLISTLAEHTKNIQQDGRVSLICHNQADPRIQTQGRVTLIGDAQLAPERERLAARYMRYFPEAEAYVQMHDFSFYRIQPVAIRYIAGFGGIHWADMPQYALQPYPLIQQEEGVIAHMNADHQDTMQHYSRHYHQFEAQAVAMLGIDCDGFDVRADDKVLRFDFALPVLDAQQARMALVEMAKIAKS
jgi:putative heme iron utilization protein